MRIKIPIAGLCEYYADAEEGKIYSYRQGVYKQKHEFMESGNKKPKVHLWKLDGSRIKRFTAVLVLGSMDGFKDLRCWEVVYKDGNQMNSQYSNIAWKQREHETFYDFLNDIEFRLWTNKLDSMNPDDWEKFNTKALRLHRLAEPRIKNDADRLEFFTELFKVEQVREIRETTLINYK